MTAKQYYAPIKKSIDAADKEALDLAVETMLICMVHEVKDLREKRNIRFDRGIFPLIREMNDKWNAVVSLCEKDYGASPIIRDGYKKFMISEIPELEGTYEQASENLLY